MNREDCENECGVGKEKEEMVKDGGRYMNKVRTL